MPKRTTAKKVARKRVRPVKPPRIPVETATVDVVEEAAPGVVTVTEYEAEVREEHKGPEQPDQTRPEEDR